VVHDVSSGAQKRELFGGVATDTGHSGTGVLEDLLNRLNHVDDRFNRDDVRVRNQRGATVEQVGGLEGFGLNLGEAARGQSEDDHKSGDDEVGQFHDEPPAPILETNRSAARISDL
jgi:hypothetical protein